MPAVRDSVEISALPEKVFPVLCNLELLLRLNASWEVMRAEKQKMQLSAGDAFTFTIKRENTEGEIGVEVLDVEKNQKLSLRYSPGKYISSSTFTLRKTASGAELSHEANITRSENPAEELRQWQTAVKFRAELEARRNPLSMVSKHFIDRILLKLSPPHRRIVLHIIFLNFMLLLMVIGLVAVIALSQKYLGL